VVREWPGQHQHIEKRKHQDDTQDGSAPEKLPTLHRPKRSKKRIGDLKKKTGCHPSTRPEESTREKRRSKTSLPSQRTGPKRLGGQAITFSTKARKLCENAGQATKGSIGKNPKGQASRPSLAARDGQ